MPKENISILGCGWLGQHLAASLINKGHSLKLSTASLANYKLLKAKWKQVFCIGIQSDEVLGDVTSFLESDILIINIPPNRLEPTKEQFASFLPLLEQSPIQKVLFVSASSVYPMLNRIVAEDEGLENKNHPLFLSEQLFFQNPNFKTTIVRMSGLIGGKRHPGRFFAKSQLIKNCKAPVNLIHREDCIQIIEQIIAQNAWAERFNACADTHPSKEEFYTAAAQSIGLEIPATEVAKKLAFKVVCNKKVKQHLNIAFKYSDLMDLIKKENWN